mmetsp:Transcript_9187/g.55800  ORF Transcript_9187/g.55800 Transcript_9187/m.55800 type:complete len:90 (-) Transcript_9187:3912-4181(-)
MAHQVVRSSQFVAHERALQRFEMAKTTPMRVRNVVDLLPRHADRVSERKKEVRRWEMDASASQACWVRCCLACCEAAELRTIVPGAKTE